ncbi:hypothetical protein JCM18899A_14530 [Nocardioides sp. AN3]
MTTTSARTDPRSGLAASRGDTSPDAGPHKGPGAAAALAPPPKLRRRPAGLAGGIVAVCLGALVAAWMWTSTTHTEEVLVARVTIPRGSLITASDLARVRINRDPAIHPLPASAYDSVIGKRAALDVAAGGLLTPEATTSRALPPRGQSVVGLSLAAEQLPGLALQTGARVRIIVTPGQNGQASAGIPAFTTAQVVDTRPDEATGNTVVDVLVPYGDAATLAARAATGNVALVLDASDTGGTGGTGGPSASGDQ